MSANCPAPRVSRDELLRELAEAVHTRSQTPSAGPLIVVVSGHGGAGKSTLGEEIAVELRGYCVGTDEFYLPEAARGKGLFDIHDWTEIVRLLTQVRRADRLRYRWRWYGGETGEVDVEMPRVLVLEGIRLIRPAVLRLVDVSVWLDCSPEVAGERAKERNRKQGDSAEEIDLWDTKWIPEGKAYECQFDPAKQVDWVLGTDDKDLTWSALQPGGSDA